MESTNFKEAANNEESQLLIKIYDILKRTLKLPAFCRQPPKNCLMGIRIYREPLKKRMGISYTEYLNKYRINRALYMLSNQNHVQIQQIAEECGYDSLCSFNRNFKHFLSFYPFMYCYLCSFFHCFSKCNILFVLGHSCYYYTT